MIEFLWRWIALNWIYIHHFDVCANSDEPVFLPPIFYWQFVVLTLIALTSAAKQKEQRVQEYFSEFQNDEDIKLITDEDERPPTTFEGSAMTAKINSLKNSNQGRGKFNYKWVFISSSFPFFLFASISFPFFHHVECVAQ